MKIYDHNGNQLSISDIVEKVIEEPSGTTACISHIGVVKKADLYREDCVHNPEWSEENCEYLEMDQIEQLYPDTLLIYVAEELSNHNIGDEWWFSLRCIVDDWNDPH